MTCLQLTGRLLQSTYSQAIEKHVLFTAHATILSCFELAKISHKLDNRHIHQDNSHIFTLAGHTDRALGSIRAL
jgi:hypothetical protein